MNHWHRIEVCSPDPESGRLMLLQVNFLRGYPPMLQRAPEYCDPGAPDEVEILSGLYDDDGRPVPETVLERVDLDSLIDGIRKGGQ